MNAVYCSTVKLVVADPVRNLLGLLRDNGKENGSYHTVCIGATVRENGKITMMTFMSRVLQSVSASIACGMRIGLQRRCKGLLNFDGNRRQLLPTAGVVKAMVPCAPTTWYETRTGLDHKSSPL